MDIIRTAKFNKDCKALSIHEFDLDKFETYLAEFPEKGNLIRGTGGLRKIRVALNGTGKSGGARVISYYHLDQMIFLLTLYKKSHQESLSFRDRVLMKKLVDEIKSSLG